MVRRIVSTVVDFDMHNLFPSATPMENLEDAASGSYEILPHMTLRERSYGKQPIMIKPDYSGDFLEKLRAPIQGKPLEVESSDPTNLLDFSDPEEMLKHQEEPNPRVLVDEFIEFPRLTDKGEWGDRDRTLTDYDDRSWDKEDAPEMSEDKIWRMWESPAPECGCFKSAKSVVASHILSSMSDEDNIEVGGVSPSTVVASYLIDRFPMDAVLDLRRPKVAKILRDFDNSRITKKQYSVRENLPGVSVRLDEHSSAPKTGRWVFHTTSGKEQPYTTIFQFIPKGTEADLNRLQVQVSCTCKSWLWWGAQYNAYMGGYLYGPVFPKLSPPAKRDPEGRFLVCKHVLACLPVVSHFRIDLSDATKGLKKKLEKEPEVVIKKELLPKKPKIPADLLNIKNIPPVKGVLKEWESMLPKDRATFMESLGAPRMVAYMAHRFPDTALEMAIPKLKWLSLHADVPSLRERARFYLTRLI